VTHRDLKPENVMRTDAGQMKLLDFGLAIAALSGGDPGSERLTAPGNFVGTPGYMAPEQLNGTAVDARTDVFAFGILIAEYATHVHPFAAATPLAVAARILEGKAAPLSASRADLPDRLVKVIDQCLEKDPRRRLASGMALVDALQSEQSHRANSDVTSWWRRHQVVTIVLYIVACVLAWQIKEWMGGRATELFFAAGIAATIAGVLRGHLLFAERNNRRSFERERRRTERVTYVTDLAIALVLALDGVSVLRQRPLIALLTVALAVGLSLTRVVVEPATTQGAFVD
jgi:hypothetical protein